MQKYTLTVYEKDGSKCLEESFDAANDQEGKTMGENKLKENNYDAHTSRVTSESGKLVHFHR
ncbi:YhzD-like protein [Scopulibacillus darangshiensis]|uniref:YhzD-like protein n=1 Tax=Scopulibacillus darangshiensis TaxID=442528 RepID=A0A4R2P3G9_9BACL|nr:YhzD family protein [Scopulibacillus darangshiensis]TCP29290.1 YhzD-like protein [Scopulibacillus darangshiensis]